MRNLVEHLTEVHIDHVRYSALINPLRHLFKKLNQVRETRLSMHKAMLTSLVRPFSYDLIFCEVPSGSPNTTHLLSIHSVETSSKNSNTGEGTFIKQLINFDKDNISDKVLKKIGTYCAQPDFQPEIVGRVSVAAKSLCMWVLAME
eukprot:g26265.t1